MRLSPFVCLYICVCVCLCFSRINRQETHQSLTSRNGMADPQNSPLLAEFGRSRSNSVGIKCATEVSRKRNLAEGGGRKFTNPGTETD